MVLAGHQSNLQAPGSPLSPGSPGRMEGCAGRLTATSSHRLKEAAHGRRTPFGCAETPADSDCLASPEYRCRRTLRLLCRVAQCLSGLRSGASVTPSVRGTTGSITRPAAIRRARHGAATPRRDPRPGASGSGCSAGSRAELPDRDGGGPRRDPGEAERTARDRVGPDVHAAGLPVGDGQDHDEAPRALGASPERGHRGPLRLLRRTSSAALRGRRPSAAALCDRHAAVSLGVRRGLVRLGLVRELLSQQTAALEVIR
jgi:hypothetical protein